MDVDHRMPGFNVAVVASDTKLARVT